MPYAAIVDLGSNTARLVVYAFEPKRWFRLVDEIREPIRLGEGLGLDGRLADAAIERAVAALELFSDYAAATGLEGLQVIGTSAVRDAVNREALFERVAPLGLSISLLSGQEEARLGVCAVANGFELDDAWVMDLGGGSAQISRMVRRGCESGAAYPLGAVRLTESHLKSDPPKRKEVKALEKAVQKELGDLAEKMRQDDLPLVAMGGAIRNLARAAQRAEGYPVEILHGYFLRLKSLEGITEKLLSATAKERASVSGINADRADIIAAGAVVYRWLARESGRDGIFISGSGLREGAFFQQFLPPPHLLPGVREFSVRNLVVQYPQPGRHSRRVKKLALRLFDGLAPIHGLGATESELLGAAASLHDIGMSVGYHLHHKHGAYLVTAARLAGFTVREQVLISLLVRYHRKGAPKLAGGTSKLARPGDDRLLARLATCLRLAEQLERSRAGRVQDVRVEIEADTVRLLVEATEEPFIEMWEVNKHAHLFRRAYGRDLELEFVDRALSH